VSFMWHRVFTRHHVSTCVVCSCVMACLCAFAHSCVLTVIGGGADDVDVAKTASELVSALQLHLFGVVIDWTRARHADLSAPSASTGDVTPEEWDRRLGGPHWLSSAVDKPCIALLMQYGRKLLHESLALLDGALRCIRGDAASPVHRSAHQAAVVRALRALEASVVYTLLPSFVAFLALLSDEPWLAGACRLSCARVCVCSSVSV
jgi:hypothetical protein